MQVILIGVIMLVLLSMANEIDKTMAEVIYLPINSVIVKGELGSERNEASVINLVENVNKVWDEANISFAIKDVKSAEMDSDKILNAMKDGKIFAEVDGYDRDAINLFFIKNMSFNGISFPEQKIVVMPDKTTNLEHVAAAHELGHVLGLDHNPSEEYLMFSVCNGTAKTITEVLGARKNAEGLLTSFSQTMLPSVSVGFSVAS